MPTIVPTFDVRNEPQTGSHPPSGPRGSGHGGEGPGKNGHWSSKERLKRYRIGLAIGIASIVMVFVSLTSAYVVRQGVSTWSDAKNAYVNDWQPLAVVPILWWNTILLLVSGITMEFARRAVFKEGVPVKIAPDGSPVKGRSVPWLAITVVLGLGFLIGQYLAWRQLRAHGIYIASNPSSSFFYVLTAAHGLHLFGGLVALSWAGISSRLSRSLEARQITTDISAWYWHFMGLLWVYILGLLYFA